jgi:hypothetical protein
MQIITVHATTIEIRWVAGFDGGVDLLIIAVDTLIIYVLALLPIVFLAYICISYTLPELNPDNSKYCGSSSKPLNLSLKYILLIF